jgi:hypothetical protein
MRRYRYVGSSELSDRLTVSTGTVVRSISDLRNWLHFHRDDSLPDDSIPATFIIDLSGNLFVASRRTEHVACAQGKDVLSAGEMFFEEQAGTITVIAVTNQSTGYCPEPDSWSHVAEAHNQIGVTHPAGYTTECIFRWCSHCGQKNVVKDNDFHCGVCGEELPAEWNGERVGNESARHA